MNVMCGIDARPNGSPDSSPGLRPLRRPMPWVSIVVDMRPAGAPEVSAGPIHAVRWTLSPRQGDSVDPTPLPRASRGALSPGYVRRARSCALPGRQCRQVRFMRFVGLSRPFRALPSIPPPNPGHRAERSALGWILMAFQASARVVHVLHSDIWLTAFRASEGGRSRFVF
jgi:hypothetical protein